MKKLLLILGLSLMAKPALAVCPVCVVAVGVGVGLTRSLGIDDTISGLWIGALMMSLVLWTVSWARKKWPNLKPALAMLCSIAFYFLIGVLPLFFIKSINHPLNTYLGFNKLFLGMSVGVVVFILATILHLRLKKLNHHKSFFPFQRVAIPLIILLGFSIVFYYLV